MSALLTMVWLRIWHQPESTDPFALRSGTDPAAHLAFAGVRRLPLQRRTLSNASEHSDWCCPLALNFNLFSTRTPHVHGPEPRTQF